MADLPPGFVLEDDAGLPPGFVLDRRSQPAAPDTQQPQDASFYDQLRGAVTQGAQNLGQAITDTVTQPFGVMQNAAALAGSTGMPQQAYNVGMEAVGGANRAAMETIDFIPEGVNAGLRLAGVDAQLPTVQGTLSPYGVGAWGYMQPGIARDVAQAGGALLTASGGLMPVARNLATLGGAAAEFAGIGSAAPSVASNVANQIVKPALSKTEQQALEIAQNVNPTGNATKAVDAWGNVITNKPAQQAVKQGFSEGLVGMINGSNPETRQNMLKMLDIVEAGKKNYEFAGSNRPLQVLGDSVLNRVKVLWQTNDRAARRLDNVAAGLRDAQVDVSPAVDDFVSELDGMGIKFDPKSGVVDFAGSDLEGLKGPQRAVTSILNRMRNTSNATAYDAHRLKKYIDNVVEYDKSKGGALGQVERVVKGLRHNIDGILDTNFSEYNKVNTEYAETRQTLDMLQEVAGKRLDMKGDNAHKALGILSRRILGNQQTTVPLIDALTELDTVAKKYAGASPYKDVVPYAENTARRVPYAPPANLNDNLIPQAMFASEMEKLFGSAAPNSFAGDIGKAVDRAVVGAATGGKTGLLEAGAKWGLDKVRGVNEQNQIKAMRELLQRGQ